MMTSVVLIGLNAMLALVAATVFRKRWMKIFALACATLEVAGVVALMVVL